jgi:hypothetical protein
MDLLNKGVEEEENKNQHRTCVFVLENKVTRTV